MRITPTFDPETFREGDIIPHGELPIVAVIGWADDWRAYQGDPRDSIINIAKRGNKISSQLGKQLFPDVAAKLRWRG